MNADAGNTRNCDLGDGRLARQFWSVREAVKDWKQIKHFYYARKCMLMMCDLKINSSRPTETKNREQPRRRKGKTEQKLWELLKSLGSLDWKGRNCICMRWKWENTKVWQRRRGRLIMTGTLIHRETYLYVWQVSVCLEKEKQPQALHTSIGVAFSGAIAFEHYICIYTRIM